MDRLFWFGVVFVACLLLAIFYPAFVDSGRQSDGDSEPPDDLT